MLLIPFVAAAGVAVLVLTFDRALEIAIRHAALVALLVLGGLMAFHLVAVADAFLAGWRRAKAGRGILHLVILTAVVLALTLTYGVLYRGTVAWATVLTKVFEPAVITAPRPPGAPTPPQWSGKERLNLLLLGLDSEGDAPQTQNTDTMIVLSLDSLNRSAAMLSVPRDTLVPIPGHRADKINAAYAYGGRNGGELARRTVEGLLGIPIHSYVLVDFPAFTRIIDGLGGVPVDVRWPVRDEEHPTGDHGVQRVLRLPGPQLLSGAEALTYARTRMDSNDFVRARRQQDVLAGIHLRLAQEGLARIPAIVEQVGPAVRTSFEPSGILPLARSGVSLDSGAIRNEVLLPCGLPGAARCQLREESSPAGYYLIPDRAKIADLVAGVFYDPGVRHEAARIEVRGSGAGTNAARAAADRLEERSFTVSRVTEGPSLPSAVVLRDLTKRHTAEVLAKQLGLEVRVDAKEPADADIVLRVGTDLAFVTDRER